jgi:hypothetical protein
MTTLGEDILTALDTKQDSDIYFYFPEENKTIYAHKIILVARSKVFKSILLDENSSRKHSLCVESLGSPSLS